MRTNGARLRSRCYTSLNKVAAVLELRKRRLSQPEDALDDTAGALRHRLRELAVIVVNIQGHRPPKLRFVALRYLQLGFRIRIGS